MRGAVEALAQGLFGEAVADQSQAVDALTRAIDAAGQAMAQKLGSMMGLSEGEGPNGGDEGYLRAIGERPTRLRNRPAGDPGSLRNPTRARNPEELRRRAGERFRPRPELDYIDRLLRRF